MLRRLAVVVGETEPGRLGIVAERDCGPRSAIGRPGRGRRRRSRRRRAAAGLAQQVEQRRPGRGRGVGGASVAGQPVQCLAGEPVAGVLRSRARVSQPRASNHRPSRSANRARSCSSLPRDRGLGPRSGAGGSDPCPGGPPPGGGGARRRDRPGRPGAASVARRSSARGIAGLERDELLQGGAFRSRVVAMRGEPGASDQRSAAVRRSAGTLASARGLPRWARRHRGPIARPVRETTGSAGRCGQATVQPPARFGMAAVLRRPGARAPARPGRRAARSRAARSSTGWTSSAATTTESSRHSSRSAAVRSRSVPDASDLAEQPADLVEPPFPEQQLGQGPAGLDGPGLPRRRAAVAIGGFGVGQPAQGVDRAFDLRRAPPRRPAASSPAPAPRPPGPRPAAPAPPRTSPGDTRLPRRGATTPRAAPAGPAPARIASLHLSLRPASGRRGPASPPPAANPPRPGPSPARPTATITKNRERTITPSTGRDTTVRAVHVWTAYVPGYRALRGWLIDPPNPPFSRGFA